MQNSATQDSSGRAILVVDDEVHFLSSIEFILSHLGIEKVDTCVDSRCALEMFRCHDYPVVLLDISMPHVEGTALLKQMLETRQDVLIIMITAVNEIDMAVSCIKAGAFDYLLKPLDEGRLASTLRNAFQLSETRSENISLREKLTSGILIRPEVFQEFVTQHNSLIGIFSYIEAIAPSSQPVLITGETGTGKELIARSIHDASGRKGAYIPVNLAGFSESMIDDAIFGHCKGAFTGAQTERAGLIEKASGGTIFLDEIGELPLAMQIKLLRLLQEGQYQPLGTDEIRNTDAKFVFATNLDIEDRVRGGLFRADLYYRLTTHRIHLPPLRERKEDIPFLVDKFLDLSSLELRKKKPDVPRQLYTLLSNYNFPGNVRELRSMVFDAMSVHSAGTLSLETFRAKILRKDVNDCMVIQRIGDTDKKVHFSDTLPTLKEVQELLIEEALKASDGNQTIAAGILGMSRRALSSRLTRHNGV